SSSACGGQWRLWRSRWGHPRDSLRSFQTWELRICFSFPDWFIGVWRGKMSCLGDAEHRRVPGAGMDAAGDQLAIAIVWMRSSAVIALAMACDDLRKLLFGSSARLAAPYFRLLIMEAIWAISRWISSCRATRSRYSGVPRMLKVCCEASHLPMGHPSEC